MKEKDYPIFAMRFKSPDSETNQDGETRLFLVSMKNKYSRKLCKFPDMRYPVKDRTHIRELFL